MILRRRALLVAFAATLTIALVSGCTAPPRSSSPPGFADFPEGPEGTFSPVKVDGVAGCSTLTLTRQPDGGQIDTSLPCLTGKRTVGVDSLGGRPTVINLWASWCTVCRKEMSVLESAYRASDGEVQFVGVDTLDEPGPAAAFLQQTEVSYPQLYDQQGELLKYTRIPGLPVTLLLDPEGREIGRHVGELTAEDLEKLLAKR